MKQVTIYTRKEWRDFLKKNHKKEKKVSMISYKKHTDKDFISHREAMEEAICFGWIDTTLKRLDEERFVRCFVKRNNNSRWSNNTLSYAKDLIKRKLMTKQGLKMYEFGKKKPTIDHNFPKNSETPEILKKALGKNLSKFESLCPSAKRMHIYSILRAKREETKKKRIKEILKVVK